MPVIGVVLLVRWGLRGLRDAGTLLVGAVVGAIAAPLEVVAEQAGLRTLLSPAQIAFLFFLLVMAVALTAQFARTLDDVDRKNRELVETNASIARFVPYGFLDALGKASVREVVRGEARRREVAVMFCDLRGFTTLAEQLGPAQTFPFINDYLARMEPEIYKGGGFINQYLGDGIMALFPSTEGDQRRSGAEGTAGKSATLALFTTAQRAYRAGEFVAADPHDVAAAFLAARCEGFVAAAPAAWDGVYSLQQK